MFENKLQKIIVFLIKHVGFRVNMKQAIGFILLCLTKEIAFGQISKFFTRCAFKIDRSMLKQTFMEFRFI